MLNIQNILAKKSKCSLRSEKSFTINAGHDGANCTKIRCQYISRICVTEFQLSCYRWLSSQKKIHSIQGLAVTPYNVSFNIVIINLICDMNEIGGRKQIL